MEGRPLTNVESLLQARTHLPEDWGEWTMIASQLDWVASGPMMIKKDPRTREDERAEIDDYEILEFSPLTAVQPIAT